jgi:endonuclease/exonuclease/phosphatase (EEP) superfamily protein YafD
VIQHRPIFTRADPKMLTVLQWVLIVLGVIAAAGTLLSLHGGSHWFVRLWDFPRVQIATVAGASGVAYFLFFFRQRPLEWAFLAAVTACVLWQGRKIFPYTPLARVQVKKSEHPPLTPGDRSKRATVRLVISNVLMENRKHARLLEVLRQADADVILAVETDDAWARALEPLAESHPYVVRQPQNNYYGLMLFSRFPLIESRVEFMVQDDIPSVHALFELPSGDRVLLHGLHPRPPEPIRDQDSTPRDAELVLMGTAIRDAPDAPTLVAGDLNDVAWSPTSELFLRLSGLLDPRIGRGFYNSFNANNPICRYPLDHVFHSNHFRLCELRRLPHVGSDHFPMLVELSYEPDAVLEQPKTAEAPGDQEEAEEKIEREVEAAATGDDRPGRE